MRDTDDNYTLDLPLLETPLQVMERVLPELEPTPLGQWRYVQYLEKLALKNADLEMLIGLRDWKKKQGKLRSILKPGNI